MKKRKAVEKEDKVLIEAGEVLRKEKIQIDEEILREREGIVELRKRESHCIVKESH